MSAQGQVMRYARNGKRKKGVPDLNVPPVENLEQAGGPALSVDQGSQVNVPSIPVVSGGQVNVPSIPVVTGGQVSVPSVPVVSGGQAQQPAGSTLPAPIDVEELDDDVVISSPRAFEEVNSIC